MQAHTFSRRWLILGGIAIATAAVLSYGVYRPEAREPAASNSMPGEAPANATAPATAPTTAFTPAAARAKSEANSGPVAETTSPVRITESLNVAAEDADKPAWPTELISERVDGQLKHLSKLLGHPQQLSSDGLGQICVEDISLVGLNPPSKPIFADTGIHVIRFASDGNQQSTTELVGLDALLDALQTMLSPFPDLVGIEAKFKIVQVMAQEHTAATTLLVSLHGQSDTRRWQRNVRWNCQWSLADTNPKLVRIENVPTADEQVVLDQPSSLFTDATESTIGHNPCLREQLTPDTNFWLSRLESAHGIDLIGSHGISVADINGDGLDDIYVCQPGGLPNRLFLAAADGTANERAAEFGLAICDTTRSALFVDLDNDGDQDLALVTADQVAIFAHQPDGKYQLREQISVNLNPTAVLAADYDSDGLLDLYVLNHDTADRSATNQAILGTPIPFHDANNGGANVLLRNLGSMQFEDTTVAVGLDSNNLRFSLAGSWEDYDDDGDMDLYVANDFGRNNLYRNDEGSFVDVAAKLGVEDLSAGMSVSWGDVDNDGQRDLYVSNMFSSAGNRIAYQRKFHATASTEVRTDFQRHARGNSLFVRSDEGRFQDVSQAWNVTMGRWAWASKFADMNNDGLQDILIANGFITNEDTHDL